MYTDIAPNGAAVRVCGGLPTGGTYNKIGNRRFLRFNVPSARTLDIQRDLPGDRPDLHGGAQARPGFRAVQGPDASSLPKPRRRTSSSCRKMSRRGITCSRSTSTVTSDPDDERRAARRYLHDRSHHRLRDCTTMTISNSMPMSVLFASDRARFAGRGLRRGRREVGGRQGRCADGRGWQGVATGRGGCGQGGRRRAARQCGRRRQDGRGGGPQVRRAGASPALGQPFEVELVLLPRVAADTLEVQATGMPGLVVAGGADGEVQPGGRGREVHGQGAAPGDGARACTTSA